MKKTAKQKKAQAKFAKASKACKIPKSVKGKRERKSWRNNCMKRRLK